MTMRICHNCNQLTCEDICKVCDNDVSRQPPTLDEIRSAVSDELLRCLHVYHEEAAKYKELRAKVAPTPAAPCANHAELVENLTSFAKLSRYVNGDLKLIETLEAAARALAETKAVETLDAMVDRFLTWRLPQSVCSDLCVTDSSYAYPRSGTSLLTADEARQMLTHVLDLTPPPASR